jgi:hypothetical protein
MILTHEQSRESRLQTVLFISLGFRDGDNEVLSINVLKEREKFF